MNTADTILVIGACGQIGSELTMALRKIYSNVIAADLKEPGNEVRDSGLFIRLDVLNKPSLYETVKK